ncbi:MAG: DEAD/DEAH box helicase [Actinomycetota bacterium]|nr:DEAD/DEAH box helicase [Actinomycetota bacterium]
MSRSTPARTAPATFAALGLPANLVTALHRRGITAPFPIQAATVPDILDGRDVLGRGQTGSGKTLAFGLPALVRLAGGRSDPKRPRALVLVPTRELALQVHDALEPYAHTLGLEVRCVVGGMAYGKQIDGLRRGVDLLVATPGRLDDLISQRACDLGDVSIAILDEADHMADMGFLPQVRKLLDQVRPGGQRLLFSATLDGDVDTLVRRYLSDPVTHSVAPATAGVAEMDHHLVTVAAADKVEVVSEIASRPGRTMFFVRTKHGADRLAKQLGNVGVLAGSLHGGKTQGQRTRTLARFKDGAVPVLVATDVAARGLHVDDVGLVVHVDPPADPKDYLHRAGRTARAGDSGTVVTLVLPHQRRDVDQMTRLAGVRPTRSSARPGDAGLATLTGARRPSGIALRAAAVAPPPRRRPTANPRHGRSGSPRGRRRPQSGTATSNRPVWTS